MKSFLPTQPNQPRSWEEGLGPPPSDGRARRLAPWLQQVKLVAWVTCSPLWNLSWRRQFLVVGWLMLFGFLSYGLLTRFVVMAVVVQGRSMLPTLQDGERYLLNRLTYLYRAPQRWELVVLRDPAHRDFAVKRIIAVPGDTLHFKGGGVYLNGEKIEESFLPPGTTTWCAEAADVLYLIGKDRYFVLGDNRACSEDSRVFGTVHRSQILGMLAR